MMLYYAIFISFCIFGTYGSDGVELYFNPRTAHFSGHEMMDDNGHENKNVVQIPTTTIYILISIVLFTLLSISCLCCYQYCSIQIKPKKSKYIKVSQIASSDEEQIQSFKEIDI